MALVCPGGYRLYMRARSSRHQPTVAEIPEIPGGRELDMRGCRVRVQNDLTIAQIFGNPGGRELDVQGPEGRDARGDLRAWKEPHERKLEVVECFFFRAVISIEDGRAKDQGCLNRKAIAG
jgi:hypothetical protein